MASIFVFNAIRVLGICLIPIQSGPHNTSWQKKNYVKTDFFEVQKTHLKFEFQKKKNRKKFLVKALHSKQFYFQCNRSTNNMINRGPIFPI